MIAEFTEPVEGVILLRWGTHPVPNCTMPAGLYARIAPRTWAAWLGEAPSVKYVYRIPKP